MGAAGLAAATFIPLAAVDVTFSSLSTAKTAFFAVNVTVFGPSTAAEGPLCGSDGAMDEAFLLYL